MTDNRVRHIVSSSDNVSLHFTSREMFKEYQRRQTTLHLEFYGRIREQDGIWAGNQNCFVATREELRPMDGTHAEDAYAAYVAEQRAKPAAAQEILIQALRDVINSIDYLRRYAAAEGRQLSGMAYQIAQDPEILRKIARDALRAAGIDLEDTKK